MVLLVLAAALISFLAILEIGYAIAAYGAQIRRFEGMPDDVPDGIAYVAGAARRGRWLELLISATLVVYFGLVASIGVLLMARL
mgnify:CR=1 FL=1